METSRPKVETVLVLRDICRKLGLEHNIQQLLN
jgi:hypothetical protein